MSRRIFISAFLIATLVAASTTDSAAQKRKKSARKPRIKPCAVQIEKVLSDTIFRHAITGIQIVSLKSGKIIYQQNPEKLLRPASNLKLLTTTAALALLGKDFQLKTEVYMDSAAGGIVKGSVYLKGYGDPLFSVADLDSLTQAIARKGITEIRGDVVGDVTYFDDTFWGKGWMWDDDPGYYWPYLTSLTVNRNTISVTASPGLRVGDSVGVTMSPPTSYVTLVNRAVTSSDTTKKLTITRLWKERLNTITLDGAIPPGGGSVTTDLNVWKPELYTLTLFKEKLLANGITVRGGIRLDTVRNQARLGVVSHPLDTVVQVIDKESMNLGAECLLKTLGAEYKGQPGSADSGTVVVKNYLAWVGIDTSAMVIVDGSGVSRYDLVTPATITRLLTFIHRNPTLFGITWSSLPLAGVDGTLKSRMAKSPAAGNARAKTGMHSDVLSLSGYVVNQKNDTLAFSMIMNHFPNNAELYRKAQDSIVVILTNCK